MNQTYKINNLYVSSEVAKELEKLWKLGIDMPTLRPSGKTSMSEILAQVGRVERFGQSSASEVDYAEPDCIPAQSPVVLVHSPHYSLRTLEVNPPKQPRR